jgi:hypothetical protein
MTQEDRDRLARIRAQDAVDRWSHLDDMAFIDMVGELQADIALLRDLEAYEGDEQGREALAMVHVGPFRRFRSPEQLRERMEQLRAVLDEIGPETRSRKEQQEWERQIGTSLTAEIERAERRLEGGEER